MVLLRGLMPRLFIGSIPITAQMNSLFVFFSTGSLLSALLIVRAKNPVHSVMFLVLVFLNTSGLFCLLGLEYFALVNLLVYVGALAVLFLFVVMLLNVNLTEIYAHQRGTYPIVGLFVALLVSLVMLALLQPNSSMLITPFVAYEIGNEAVDLISWSALNSTGSNVKQLGVALYTLHADLLILASLLLLVAIVGAVALTLKRRAHAPQQDVFAQHNRDFQKIVAQITTK
jgi:NADH-quinone oxidoreductase subunit J